MRVLCTCEYELCISTIVVVGIFAASSAMRPIELGYNSTIAGLLGILEACMVHLVSSAMYLASCTHSSWFSVRI